MDFDRFHGMTVHPFTTDEGQQALFVKADPHGNPTDYVKDGEETDGKSFFHYVDLNLKGRCHFKDGDWTNLCRDNWEANAGRFTKQERRIRRSMNRSS